MPRSLQTTGKATSHKPRKPHRDFPLYAHASGRWAKKVRQKLHYFGRWEDPDAALAKWLEQKDDLLAGRTPRAAGSGLTMRDLCNSFLTAKKRLVDARELTPRTFADYFATCERLVNAFGKTRLVDDLASEDFEQLRAALSKTWGPVAVGNEINRIRVVFKYAFDAGLIDRQVRYGPHFKRPSRKVLRQARAAKGPRLFEAAQLRKLIGAAAQPLRAMILLGINCGLGNSDVGQLERRHLDLHRGWLDYPRPKTGIERRAKLWPETVAAIREALEKRPEPKDETHADLVFVTRVGGSWAKDVADSPISKETDKVLHAFKMKRPGLSFYALRHTFETIAGDTRDQVAVNFVMGHAPASSDMASVYRERISDERLKAVSDHVRRWLFPPKKRTSQGSQR
jgi:integrase